VSLRRNSRNSTTNFANFAEDFRKQLVDIHPLCFGDGWLRPSAIAGMGPGTTACDCGLGHGVGWRASGRADGGRWRRLVERIRPVVGRLVMAKGEMPPSMWRYTCERVAGGGTEPGSRVAGASTTCL
jgi:hypothetical protein